MSAGDREKFPFHRRFVRKKVRVKVALESTEAFTAWTINVSADGLCFEIPRRIKTGDDVTVTIFIGRGKQDPPVQARARVVWNERGRKDTRHGAQFQDFDDGGRERLADWIRSA